MKNFDLEAAKRGAAVCIRSGENARIICYDKKGATPCLNNHIIYLANYNGREHTYSCYSDGRYMTRGEDDADLMMRDDDYLEKLERGEYGNHIEDKREMVGANEFEKYPRLADYIRSMATTGQLPSDWSGFIAALNGGLASTTDREYWRYEFAGRAMSAQIAGVLINGAVNRTGKSTPDVITEDAVLFADALIEQLEKTEK